ncbi:MAG TPA: translation elongation factor 4 [Oscillospiraceae bacterium]|nr:translation elongation factor 4 [Oscillospiraceae bacterium]
MQQKNIRNFSIIAHIDHGKSTLADRLLEATGALSQREMSEQVLDQLDLERERGITIKLQAVRLMYQAQDGQEYMLNLIDTPGHVDFTYEVSRSLAACEGALLVIDAAQGIEAQTLANVYLALEHNLEIIPVINKIDLPSADVEKAKRELEEVIGLSGDEAVLTSAKTGLGITEVLEAVVQRVPAPQGERAAPLRALIFDSHYDSYRGAIAYVRITEGTLTERMKIKMMSNGKVFEVSEIGSFTPHMTRTGNLAAGEVGYVVAGVKNVKDTRVGDTITVADNPAVSPLPGYQKANPMVYCGFYPADSNDYVDLRDALEKLNLNDAALTFEPETSEALGFGFRCGFLGLLHMEIIQERLEREYKISLITTAPNVVYHATLNNGELLQIDNPTRMPQAAELASVAEPFVSARVIMPNDYVGAVMELCQEKRGIFINMEYLDTTRVTLIYEMPLSEIVFDFFDLLKSRTRGYASFDYELVGYRESKLVKVDILLNGAAVDALSFIAHLERATKRGRELASKLRELIPRQMFEVPIQAAIGQKVIARETIKAMRKNVLDKCYGGDITRKRKLLEKQKAGKKRMKQVGNVEIPQEAFMAVLSID